MPHTHQLEAQVCASNRSDLVDDKIEAHSSDRNLRDGDGVAGRDAASCAGISVTGSDAAAYPPMSDLLESLGIPVTEPYAEKNLEPRPDLVIVGNAISRGNVELEHVLDQRIPFRSHGADCCMRISDAGASRWWWRERMARRRRQHAGVDLSRRRADREAGRS